MCLQVCGEAKSHFRIVLQSLQYALVDLKSAQGMQALYVMISRTISLNNLAGMWSFLSNNLDHRLSPTYQNEFD